MDIEDLILEVRYQLDEPRSSYLTNEKILRWLNQGQLVIAKLTKCLVKHVSETLPSSYKGLISVDDALGIESVIYEDSGGTARMLRGVSWDEATKLGLVQNSTGTPTHFIFGRMPDAPGTYIFLLPMPSEDLTVSYRYYAKPATMYCAEDDDGNPINSTTNVDPEIPEEYHDALVTWCRYKKLAMQEDPAYQAARAEFYEEIRALSDATFVANFKYEDEMSIDYF